MRPGHGISVNFHSTSSCCCCYKDDDDDDDNDMMMPEKGAGERNQDPEIPELYQFKQGGPASVQRFQDYCVFIHSSLLEHLLRATA